MAYPHAAEVGQALSAAQSETSVVGLHGTSVWAVIAAAMFGRLPNRVIDQPLFYYLPTEHAGARATAKEYALSNGRLHFAMAFLAYPGVEALYEGIDQGDLNIDATFEGAKEDSDLRGVIVGLAPSITRLPAGPAEDPERCVRTPERGLPLSYVATIEPLGKTDRGILSDHDLGPAGSP